MPPRIAAGPKRDSSARGARREDQLGGQVGAEANPQHTERQADDLLRQHAEEIRSLAKRTVEDIIKIGRLLTDARKRMPHGGWLPWLEREFGWSADTATNFMNVYKLSRRPKFRKIRNMARLAPSLLYALAKAPDEVAVPIMDRIERGESVSPRSVTATVAEHTQKIVTPYYVKPDAPRSSRPWPSRAVQFPASVAEPDQPADDEREMRKVTKEVRTARLIPRGVAEAAVVRDAGALSVITFTNASREEQQRFLSGIGIDALLGAMPTDMLAELHRRFLDQYRQHITSAGPNAKPLTQLELALGQLAAEQDAKSRVT